MNLKGLTEQRAEKQNEMEKRQRQLFDKISNLEQGISTMKFSPQSSQKSYGQKIENKENATLDPKINLRGNNLNNANSLKNSADDYEKKFGKYIQNRENNMANIGNNTKENPEQRKHFNENINPAYNQNMQNLHPHWRGQVGIRLRGEV